MKKGSMHDNNGFSLVELIVVILIIGILSTGAVMSFSAYYNADTERAAKRIMTVLSEARTEAITYNSDTDTRKVNVVAYIEQRENGDCYAGVVKKSTITDPESHTTTYTEEDLKEVKLANYRVQVILSKKGTTDDPGEELQYDTAQTWGGTGRIEYSFKRGTGRLVPSIASSDYCDISVVGSDTFKVIISTASGKCMLDD